MRTQRFSQLPVAVTSLDARVPDGIAFQWQGRELRSGPLTATLDRSAASTGNLDYSSRRAELEFNVELAFPEFSALLSDLGVDPALAAPVRAVIGSSGDILPDHSLALDGPCRIADHKLLHDSLRGAADQAAAAMLPGT